jgi:hypothetical protein
MTYTTMGLARAILAIKRAFEAEGRHLTIGNLAVNLPGDITLAEFKRAICMAADLIAAQEEARRAARRRQP